MSADAQEYVKRLKNFRSSAERDKYRRYFKPKEGASAADDDFIGVRMGQVFALSDEFKEMPPREIEKLLKSPIHEARAGALKIMAKQASSKKTDDARRKELFELYLRRSDGINNWDLVDLAAPDVIGRYLIDKPRRVLYKLARSKDPWERRTAIVATLYLVRQGEVDDTFKLSEILAADDHDLVQKAVGGLLREAGKKDQKRLVTFLRQHAASMSRAGLRYAIEHLEPAQRDRFLTMKPDASRSTSARGARTANKTTSRSRGGSRSTRGTGKQ